MSACPHCGKDHPATEHVLAFARGDDGFDVEPGTHRLDLDLREGALLALALKNLRAVAEEGGDTRLAGAARRLELKASQAVERDGGWRASDAPEGDLWRERIIVEAFTPDTPDRALTATFTSDRIPTPVEFAAGWATALGLHARVAPTEADGAPITRIVLEVEPLKPPAQDADSRGVGNTAPRQET